MKSGAKKLALKKILYGTTMAAAVTALAQSGAFAQDGSGEGGFTTVFDEIIVTATRREAGAQSVPISITAYSGEQIERLGVRESTEIANFVPGVNLTGSSGGQFVSFSIRGVSQNEFSDFAEAPNAVYIDDTYIAMMNSQRFAAFDVDRVEVLKGPQGTLFGRNATGGLVHYISRRPTEAAEGYLEVTYGRFNQAQVRGAIAGPISDNVQMRGAIYYNRHDPIFENLFPEGEDEWNDDTLAGRIHLQWTPGEDLTILATAYGGESTVSSAPYKSYPTVPIFDADGNVTSSIRADAGETRAGIGPGGVNICPGCFYLPTRPVPGGDGLGYLDADPDGLTISKDAADSDGSNYWMVGGTVRIDWALGLGDLVSISDYKNTYKETRLEVDNGPVNQTLFPALAEGKQFSQELRLSSSSDSLNWLVGAYYLNFKLDPVLTGFEFPALTIGGPQFLGPTFAGTYFSNSGTQKTTSYSVFGDVDIKFSDQLTLSLGARLIQEEKEFTHRTDVLVEGAVAVIPSTVLVPNLNPIALLDLESSDTLWSGRSVFTFTPNDDLLIFAGVNRGIKAGGFNQNLAGFPPVPTSFTYDPEVLWAYEAGFKASILDGMGRLNGSVYYYDYNDYQAFQFIGLSNFVINADAETIGAELELILNPVPGLDLLLSGSYVDSEVKDVPFSSGPDGASNILLDREPAYTPPFQATGLARYEWSLGGNSGNMSVQVDAAYSDGFFYFLSNNPATSLDSRFIANARIAWRSANDQFGAEFFVENFTDERYEQIGFDLSTTCGCSVTSFGKPLWWGFSLSYRFGN